MLLKSDLDVNKPVSEDKSSCLAPALGLTKLTNVEIRFGLNLVVLLKSDLNV